MEKSLAAEIVEATKSINETLNKVHELVEAHVDEPLRAKFRVLLGEAMQQINFDILMPIVQKHADLDPDKK